MSKGTTIASGVSWSIIQNIVSILYGIVSVPFLINYFGKAEYGLIGLATSVNVYVHLMDMGMSSTNVKFFSEFLVNGDKDKIQRLFSTMHSMYLIIGFINSAILFVLSFFVSDLFKVTPDQAVVLRNLLLILGLNAVFSWISACYDQFLQANDLLSWTKKRLTLLKLLQFVVLVTTIMFKLSIEVYFFFYVFMVTFILPLSVIKVQKIAPSMKKNFRIDGAILRLVIPFALSIFSFSIFQFLALNFRPLVLGNMSGPVAVAEFNVMNTIALAVTVFSNSFIQVLIPVVTKAKASNDVRTINVIMKDGTKYVTILLSTVIFILVISAKEILKIYVGDDFVHLFGWVALWLLTLLLSHRNAMTSMVFTENKLMSVVIMSSFAMVVAFTAYFLLVPKLDVGGVVVGFTLHELIHTLFYYVYFLPKVSKIHTKEIFIQSVLPVIILLGISALLIYLLFGCFNLSEWCSVIGKTIVALFLFAVVIWFVLLRKSDKQRLLSYISLRKTGSLKS